MLFSHAQSDEKVDSILNTLQKQTASRQDSLDLAYSFIKASDYFYDQEFYSQSLDFALSANEIYLKLDPLRSAEAYTKISLLYDCLGNYPDGVEASHNALEIYLEYNDYEGIASSYNDIAVFHYYNGEYDASLEYLEKAYEYYKDLQDESGISMYYNNAGNVYYDKGNLDLALDYYYQAYQLDSATQDREGMAITLSNLGETYTALGEYTKAQTSLIKSYKIASGENDVWGMTNPLRGLANLSEIKGDINSAIKYTEESIQLAESIGAISELSESYRMLSSLYQKSNDFETALKFFTLHKKLEDSIFNSDNAKILNELETKFQTKQKEKKIELLKKDAEIEQMKYNEEIATQHSRMIYLIIGLIAAGGVGLLFYISYVNKKKANLLLVSQNEIIQDQKNKLQHTYLQLEEQNNSILDSINYAKRIQQALLSNEERASEHLPDHFVIFLPKDIVSGDFYWALEKDDFLYFAVGDCTGHGVPGAFLTMLGISFLNDICNTAANSLSPGEILDKLRSKFIAELHQTGQSESSKDGMDISLARLNFKTKELQWAGANNPCWIIRNPSNKFSAELLAEKGSHVSLTHSKDYQILELKPDKQPIGYSFSNLPYTDQSINLLTDDMVYLFSDGFADQFGGEKGKKFKYKPFKTMLAGLSELPMDQQKNLVLEQFENWKGNHEQIDDVCVLGVKV